MNVPTDKVSSSRLSKDGVPPNPALLVTGSVLSPQPQRDIEHLKPIAIEAVHPFGVDVMNLSHLWGSLCVYNAWALGCIESKQL